MIQTIKLQELHTAQSRHWFGSGAHTHVLAWSEVFRNFADWSLIVHPAAKKSFVRDYRAHRITVHTCWSGVEDPRVHAWPWFDALLAYTETPVPPRVPTHHYVCQNLTVRPHRTSLIDQLAKRGLLDRGRVSYGYRVEPQPNNNGRNRPPARWGRAVEAAWIERERDLYQLPNPVDIPAPPTEIWSKTAVNIITETHHDHVTQPGTLWTEKTWQAVWLRRPLIVCGQPGANLKLQAQGFRLMEGIEDWSWDHAQNPDKRIRGLAQAVEHMTGAYTPGELQEMNREVVEHNRAHLIRVFLDTGLPKILSTTPRVDSPGAEGVCDYLVDVYNAIRSQL
jgi:hypothetical protein